MNVVDKIIQEMDKTLVLGAAWDCLNDAQQKRFKDKLTKLLEESKHGEEVRST